MLMVSVRQNFWSSDKLSVNDAFREINLDDDSLGTDMLEADFIKKVSGKKILILVHGYNNDEDDVVNSYKIIEKYLYKHETIGHHDWSYDTIIGYTWPGGDMKLSYFAAKSRASAVGARFSRLLAKILPHSTSVDIQCHSMGARVVLEALHPDQRILQVRHVFALAAAVDNESIEYGEKFYPSTLSCQSFLVFHSNKDNVLKFSFKFADFDAALGYSGPEDLGKIFTYSNHVKVINCKAQIKGHSEYKNNTAYYNTHNQHLQGLILNQFLSLT